MNHPTEAKVSIVEKIKKRWKNTDNLKLNFLGRLTVVGLGILLLAVFRIWFLSLNDTPIVDFKLGVVLLQFVAAGFLMLATIVGVGFLVTLVSVTLSWVLFGDGDKIADAILRGLITACDGAARIIKFVIGGEKAYEGN